MHSFAKFSAALALAAFASAASAQFNLPNPLSSKEKESLSKTDINLVLASNKSAIDNCQAEHKKKEPKATGQLVMRFEIEPSGKTSNIRAVDTKLGNSTFGNCVTKVVREMSFPKHKQKGKPIDQVFTF
jgi:hypothetical protein